MYFASFLLQSNLGLFQVWAKEVNTSRVNIVAILVDNKIYWGISWWLSWYASDYIQSKLSDTKALVMPINLDNIEAYDIYRMMENIYFDGLENTNSSLIGLIMFWSIPLPVVNQDWYIFPTVYPYVDFEDQKYVWDENSKYFVSNWNPWWQAEIWHWLIDYWWNIQAYIDFFKKVSEYEGDHDNYIWDSIWYEDFIAQKEAFLDDDYQYYRNKVMFWEDIWYQRYSTLMKKMFWWESSDNVVDILEKAWWLLWLDVPKELNEKWEDTMHTTKMNQQEIETSYLADYNELFSKSILSIMRENILAWWRWKKIGKNPDWKPTEIADSDSSASKIQLKDTLYLWNDNLQWLIENFNSLMEDMIDRKINENKYDMDIVLPVTYMKTVWKRLSFRCYRLVSRFDNYYFWNNARYIDNAKDLSIYRWTYRNLLDLDWVTIDSLQKWNNPTKSEYDPVNLNLRSIWASYDIFSNQAEWNKWYLLTAVERDLNIYDEEKTAKNIKIDYKNSSGKVKRIVWPDFCIEDSEDFQCENLFDFAQRWWWWASPINLDDKSISDGRYKIKGYVATDAWRSIFDMWWFQSLLSGDDEWLDGTWRINWDWVWPQWAANSFKSYIKYSSPTEREWWDRIILPPYWKPYIIFNNHVPNVHMDFSRINYRDLDTEIINKWIFSKESDKIFNVNVKWNLFGCNSKRDSALSEEYTYKIISSITKHVSTTEDEINWIDRDRYGENWTLWQYYRDLKKSYESVENDTLEVLDSSSKLIDKIKEYNNIIKIKMDALLGEGDKLSSVETDISLLESEIKSLEEELNGLEGGDAWLENLISDKKATLQKLKSNNKIIQWNFSEFLSEIKQNVNEENLLLTDIYKLIMSLSADNIFSVMEYINYMEWWNPENFYNGVPNDKKVGFLPDWISSIQWIESNIKENGEKIITKYNEVYGLVAEQQTLWRSLASKLKSLGDSYKNDIDEVSGKMDVIFVISEDNTSQTDVWESLDEDSEWDEESYPSETTLTLLSAEDAIKTKDWLFDRFDSEFGVNAMFFWLVEEDTKWPEIEQAARRDKDFLLWLNKNSIKVSDLSQSDWINQYAQWTKWPWYDSEWAKKNHDLLLWVSEHMSWMNILTPDRPIDSPRYVSMQSVAWNEMKFIYPDLFKVEVYEVKGKKTIKDEGVFDVHKLLPAYDKDPSVSDIKKNLEKYLKWKVEEYNKILKSECESALDMNDYFDKLKKMWYVWAIPDIWVHGCGKEFIYEDFIEALWWDLKDWWEAMLKNISEILYYQNLTNKKKLGTWDVAKDIELIKNTFSLNDKRKQTLEYYLKRENNLYKNPFFVIPTYQLSWYEVAYVNSNWKDYIFPDAEPEDDKFSWIVDYAEERTNGIDIPQPSQTEQEIRDECGIPSTWRLPIFGSNPTWLQWFKCWLKKTKQQPLKIKLKFDSSLGEILSADSLSDYVKNSDLGQTFSDWWNSMDRFADAWDEIVDSDSTSDADKLITQMQVEADKHNQSELWWDTWMSNFMGIISREVIINNTNALLSDSDPYSELTISSLSDIGNIEVEFIWTWDWCLTLNGNTLCKWASFVTTFNPKTNPFKGLVVSDNVAWKDALDIRIGGWWGYIEKVLKYTVSPSMLLNAEIKVEDDKTIEWMITPVEVIWYDKYNNRVSWWLEKYEFTVSQWRFLKDWAYQESFTTNDFRDLKFYYQAPVEAEGEAVIKITSVRDPSIELAEPHHQKIVQASPEIKLDWSVMLKWKYDLETDWSYRLMPYLWSPYPNENIYLGDKLNIPRLHKLEVDMKDASWEIVDVDAQIIVTSKNWLVIIWQVQKQENWEDFFFETSMNYMSGGHVTLYYYPTTVAGDDVINIDIPWLDMRKINVKITPAATENVQTNIDRWYVKLWDLTDLEIMTSDRYGNPSSALLYLEYDPDYVELPYLVDYFRDMDEPTVVKEAPVNNWYLKTQVDWIWAWIVDIYVLGIWPIYFKVDSYLFPEDNLNIMYLNYFGDDRWNQWWYFSDNNKYIEKLMTNSERIITTTTQLISEDKIKRMVRRVDPWFKISNLDGFDNILTIKNGEINVVIWWASSMHLSAPSFTMMTAMEDQFNSALLNKIWASLVFLPNDIKYSMDKDGVLYDDGNPVWNILLWDISLKLSDSFIDNGDNIWDIVGKWSAFWRFIIHYPNFIPSVWNLKTPGSPYMVGTTFSNWSTNRLSSVGIFDKSSQFELDTSYKSIQNSDDVDEKVGFLGDFKNITLFAEWEIVWEATKKFGSEFVINLWDPVLSRKNDNDPVPEASFDWWIWNEIYVDSQNDIFWTYEIDFNSDWSKDLLVVYLDWTVKLAKNYWWAPDLRNMQELMHVSVGIKEIFVWDADGAWGEDILVLTDNNQIRAYLNNGGAFDVDGSVACLNQNVFDWEKSLTPSSLEWISQLFIEDMDLDGILDIVTYDEKWYIKVFFWWWKENPHYLSKDKFSCDGWWYDREIWNTTIVDTLWVQVVNKDIYDNSLLHWSLLERPKLDIKESELPEYGVKFDPKTLEMLIKSRWWNTDWDISAVTTEIMENFDVKQASQKYVDDWARYVDVSLYGDDWKTQNYLFIPSSYLWPQDNLIAWLVKKNYYVKSWSTILQDGDIVTVRVTITGNPASIIPMDWWIFADIVQWPWNLYYDDEWMLKSFRFISNPSGAVLKRKNWEFAYVVDGISLWAWAQMSFEYDLEYNYFPLKKLSITHNTFYGQWPDIKSQAIDWCEKDFDVYHWGGRSFPKETISLQKMINDEYLEEERKTEDYAEDVINNWSDVNQLPWIVWDKISRSSLLKKSFDVSDDDNGKSLLTDIIGEWLESMGATFNIDLNILEEQAGEIANVVDDITKWMCNWFSFGWSNNCKWLPVPFNQAFLAPGKYHIFGCRNLPVGSLEWWIPTFFFPGTMYVSWVPVPIPWWLKQSGTDGFMWPWGWEFPSFIRIYAAPTMTAQLWIAICMWKYMSEKILPSPLSEVTGNCIIFTVKPQCKAEESDDEENSNKIVEEYPEYIEEVRDSWVCLQSKKWPMITLSQERSSPFNLYSYIANKLDVNWWSNNSVSYSTSFLWIIELETDSYVWSDDEILDGVQSSIVIWDVDILWWDFKVNKIRWWIQQWVRKILIDNWLDPQIRYILNQLTKMHVNIKFPDISNLVDHEVKTMQNLSKNIWTIWENKEEKRRVDPVSSRSDITYDKLTEFNKSISNPFESLASLMNESNIVNISTETLVVKVPMIFAEDINEYYIYLQQWLDKNKEIVDGWETLLNTFKASCSKEPTEEKQDECRKNAQKNIDSFIEFKQWDWQKMQNQIYANLIILQKYRNFPFEIYERVHVIDRYMSEIASLINNVIWYLSYWTSTNSERFVWYVDAIVLIINIIKTYQLLIDFSIEWGQNCGNCTKDTYDQYSCKLSLLCDNLSLPILQIPNFKLPNITIDLTNINLWLDIVLPNFNFQPVRIDLPQLPNLPEPPSISMNIKLFDLPNIPLLPEPPELPELPSFIPEVELELPILPPAPEVPAIPDSLVGIINTAKYIWKIYCIVKRPFWLVWESSVKAKIEQLTQRTYEVDWIDNIMDFTNWVGAPIHNFWVDYEIDSYVDLQFNFTDFYDYLDTLTKWINNLTTSATKWANNQTNNLVNDNSWVDASDSIDWASVEVNMKLVGDGWVISKWNVTTDVDWLVSDDIEYVDYDRWKARFMDILSYFKQEVNNTSFDDSIGKSLDKIENQINRRSNIVANYDWIENVRKNVIAYLDDQKVNYDNLANMIQSDYDGFLAMVNSNSEDSIVWEDEKFLTFNVQLFNTDPSTKDSIMKITKANPYASLLDNKQNIIDWYRKAINRNSADDLWLTESQYLVLRDSISSMRNKSNTLYDLVKPVSSTNLIAKNWGSSSKSLVAWWWLRIWSQKDVATVIDPSVLSKWIYDKNSDWKMVKVVYSDSFAEKMQASYYRTKDNNFVFWNGNSIYKKCSWSCLTYYSWRFWKFYSSSVINEVPYEETWVDFDGDTRLKIADNNREVKNRKVTFQNADILSFSRKLDNVDAYLIKLVKKIDESYEKLDYSSTADVHYVLALPEYVSMDDIYANDVKIELLNKKIHKIQDLYWNRIVQVVYYNPNKRLANISISDVDRKWYYFRIATLDLNLVDDTYIYNITSPWSNQVVAWKQIVWDDRAPSWNPVLFRPSVPEVASEWDDLEWYVSTKYELIVNWEDNVALSYVNISKDGEILQEKYTSSPKDSIKIKLDLHTKSEKETYTIFWIDQLGNKTEKLITISYYIPEVTITNISKNAEWWYVSITAELSHDLDQWNITFQRRRWELWKSMKRRGIECADIPLKPGDFMIVWDPYTAWNEIAMYDAGDEVIALMDPNTAEIKFQAWYIDSFDINVVVQNGTVLQIINKYGQKPIFSISLPMKECKILEAKWYNVVDLPEKWKMGMFNGWKAVYKDWTNVLFVSPTCHLYSELWLEWEYSYDREREAIILTLYQPSDLLKSNPIKLWFKVKPLVE